MRSPSRRPWKRAPFASQAMSRPRRCAARRTDLGVRAPALELDAPGSSGRCACRRAAPPATPRARPRARSRGTGVLSSPCPGWRLRRRAWSRGGRAASPVMREGVRHDRACRAAARSGSAAAAGSMRSGSRYIVTTLAAEMSAASTSPCTNDTRSATPARARVLARLLHQLGSSSMPRPRAPNFCAAAITMRPSPEPRSTTRSPGRVCGEREHALHHLVGRGDERHRERFLRGAQHRGKERRSEKRQAAAHGIRRSIAVLHFGRVPVDLAEVAVARPCRRAR